MSHDELRMARRKAVVKQTIKALERRSQDCLLGK